MNTPMSSLFVFDQHNLNIIEVRLVHWPVGILIDNNLVITTTSFISWIHIPSFSSRWARVSECVS